MRNKTLSFALVLALLVALIPSVAPTQAQDDVTIRFAVMPVLDVLPFFVAEQAGYFAEAGIKVEGVPVSGPIERDQVFMAGAANAMLTDLMGVAIFNQDEPQMQVVAQARRAYPDAPMFRILAAPGSDIATPEDLKGVEIAISQNTIIQYLTQRILERAGLSVDDLVYRPEPNIPVRFQLLMEGAIPAANLPDPLAQAAIQAGAVLVADDTVLAEEEFSQSVLSVSTALVEENPEAVQAFVAAWMRAAEDLNTNPEAYRDLWMEKTNVPDSVKDSYTFPPFPVYAITTESAWDDTVGWLVELDIVDKAADYAASVNPTFVDALKPAEAAGDPVNGEALFVASCAGCHSVEPGVVMVGPSLAGLAEIEVEGMTAAEYIHQSIVEPGAFVVEGLSNIMPAYDTLPESDVNDLVAYLLSLD